MQKEFPQLSEYLPKNKIYSIPEVLFCSWMIIMIQPILYVVFGLSIAYTLINGLSINNGLSFSSEYLNVFIPTLAIGSIIGLILVLDGLMMSAKIVEVDDIGQFISLLDRKMLKMDYGSKKRIEEEGIYEFKPLNKLESITWLSHVGVQFVQEGKVVIRGPKDYVEELLVEMKIAPERIITISPVMA